MGDMITNKRYLRNFETDLYIENPLKKNVSGKPNPKTIEVAANWQSQTEKTGTASMTKDKTIVATKEKTKTKQVDRKITTVAHEKMPKTQANSSSSEFSTHMSSPVFYQEQLNQRSLVELYSKQSSKTRTEVEEGELSAAKKEFTKRYESILSNKNMKDVGDSIARSLSALDLEKITVADFERILDESFNQGNIVHLDSSAVSREEFAKVKEEIVQSLMEFHSQLLTELKMKAEKKETPVEENQKTQTQYKTNSERKPLEPGQVTLMTMEKINDDDAIAVFEAKKQSLKQAKEKAAEENEIIQKEIEYEEIKHENNKMDVKKDEQKQENNNSFYEKQDINKNQEALETNEYENDDDYQHKKTTRDEVKEFQPTHQIVEDTNNSSGTPKQKENTRLELKYKKTTRFPS